MTKTSKTAVQLEMMILKDLSAFSKCSGVSMITIRHAGDEQSDRGWRISHVNYGSSLESDCRVPMTQIVNRCRQEFDLA